MKYTTFYMEGYKAGSARQAMFNEFGILNSFTVEDTFFTRFTEADLLQYNETITAKYAKIKAKKE